MAGGRPTKSDHIGIVHVHMQRNTGLLDPAATATRILGFRGGFPGGKRLILLILLRSCSWIRDCFAGYATNAAAGIGLVVRHIERVTSGEVVRDQGSLHDRLGRWGRCGVVVRFFSRQV
uniref:Uncharacterized protein n=1 Tax=Nelumbo nucifera TaxID=4432 RepID=A0A822XZX0_NELNU|nr:TPA_asm: hypothetical protein HUJ06_028672 [Nelumbo nucifera]